MLDHGAGHIVNVSTTLVEYADSTRPSALQTLTKGGLVAVTRSLAMEYASRGLRVNAVSLGVIETPLHDKSSYAEQRTEVQQPVDAEGRAGGARRRRAGGHLVSMRPWAAFGSLLSPAVDNLDASDTESVPRWYHAAAPDLPRQWLTDGKKTAVADVISCEGPMRRAEEILEIAEIVDEAAERLATVLERSGADELHPPRMLRELARCELDLAAADIASLTFGNPPNGIR